MSTVGRLPIKTFANAGNECEGTAGLKRESWEYLSGTPTRRDAEALGSHTGRGAAPSAWFKVYRPGKGSRLNLSILPAGLGLIHQPRMVVKVCKSDLMGPGRSGLAAEERCRGVRIKVPEY
jgi:hypothetical protein